MSSEITADTEKPNLAVLLVCRNRREMTLAAIRRLSLQNQSLPHRVVLFDDGSTDGTIDAVRAEVPDALIISGDGSAFWNRGLYLCWTHALELPCEAFLWLNDDVVLDDDAFTKFLSAYKLITKHLHTDSFVLVGSTRGSKGEVTYGGLKVVPSPFALKFRMVSPQTDLTQVDTFNGNVVFVTRPVIDQIGLNDPQFHHNMGDIDYGLRATKAGIPVMLLPDTIGLCESNNVKKTEGFGSPKLTIREQWKKVNTHHGLPFGSWLRLTRRHSGPWWLLHFVVPYRRLLGMK